jgi:hypothetical protein
MVKPRDRDVDRELKRKENEIHDERDRDKTVSTVSNCSFSP